MQAYPSREDIIENMQDAGLGTEAAESIAEDLISGDREHGIKRLMANRKALLEGIHQRQKHIDRLDYLINQIQKNKIRRHYML